MARSTKPFELPLRPIDLQEDWNIGMVSMPLPRGSHHDVKIKGAKVQTVPVAFWPRSEKFPGGPRIPRRSLVFFTRPKSGGVPEATVSRRTRTAEGKAVHPDQWSVQVRQLESIAIKGESEYFNYFREPCEVVMSYGRKKFGLRLAIENETGLHLWQYVNSELLWSGPLCAAYRIGGHIFTGDEERCDKETFKKLWGEFRFPDNTIQASVYLILFHDGTIRITGHWINGRIYGSDCNQTGVPVVVFRGLGTKAALNKKKWTGADPVLPGSAATLDLTPAAHLVSEEFPGRFAEQDDNLLLWYPVQDTTIRIRYLPGEKPGEIRKFDVDNSHEGFVMGAARSITWDMKFGGVPGIQRFLAPASWYGSNEEFAPMPIKIREGRYTAISREGADELINNSVKGRFTSGGIFRYLDRYGKGCYEISMDGNESRSLYRRAYWDADATTYDLAARNVYFCADIAVDHVRDVVHYHGDKGHWRTYSSIYMRFSGLVLGYAETGDYYLLETAESVARNYMTHHLQNWPRMGIGRDADPLLGICLLWDYTGDETYFNFARKHAGHFASVIMKDGSWHCGSGVGPLMGCNADIGTSWNGGHFFNGFTPYVARDHDVPEEWLQSARRGLKKLFGYLEKNHKGFHPASNGFMGGPHWYLACRLGDEELIGKVHKFMETILEYHDHPWEDRMFHSGKAHHMNNYVDFLLFYECTKDTLPKKV